MSQDSLSQAHRLLTAAIVDQSGALTTYLSAEEATPHWTKLQQLRQVPMIGAYIDTQAQRLVISIDRDHARKRDDHERLLRQALGSLPIELVYAKFEDHGGPKNGTVRPLWGGVVMETKTAGGTLTLVVAKNTVQHTLVSAHVVGVNTLGKEVGQPNARPANEYGVVTDNPAGPKRQSDAALASTGHNGIQGEIDQIWRSADQSFRVVGKARADQLTRDTVVYMQGAVGFSEGRILEAGVLSKRQSGLTLENQVMASYTSIPGDSGGAVFLRTDKDDEVIFAGINVGLHNGNALFSPWEGIASDLGL